MAELTRYAEVRMQQRGIMMDTLESLLSTALILDYCHRYWVDLPPFPRLEGGALASCQEKGNLMTNASFEAARRLPGTPRVALFGAQTE
jgi:hypothetical protein